MRTATPAEETVQIAGQTWVRVEGTMDGLRSADSDRNIPRYVSEGTLRRAIQAQEAERQRDQAQRREAEQARARLDAMPIEVIGGIQYRQHPDEPALLVTVQSGTVLSRQRVEQITADRAQQAARDQRRNDLHAATSPAPLAAKIAELEALIAQTRAGK